MPEERRAQGPVVIASRQAAPDDAAKLNAALARLSADMGDTHRATTDIIAHALGAGVVRAIIAGADEMTGVAVYSPVLSTTKGMTGVYVSDLWIAPEMRGGGMGRSLLHAVAIDARKVWRAAFLKLMVYDDNPGARAFYDRLGFKSEPREIPLHIVFEELLRGSES